jgi:subtilisin-like proprotein convertase family protein
MHPRLILATWLIGSSIGSQAALTSDTDIWNVNLAIPDNNATGLVVTRQVMTDITAITRIEVDLGLSGGWFGDIYAYLTNTQGLAVLLNGPGRTENTPEGSSAVSVQITLKDGAVQDIHNASGSGGTITGTYQPDGRNVDPSSSLDSSPRTAMLSNFNGQNPNGQWTLFIADTAAGDTMVLNYWSMRIVGVPEPSSMLLTATGLTALLFKRRRI